MKVIEVMDEKYIGEVKKLVEAAIGILKEKKAIKDLEENNKKRIPTQASSDFLIHKEQGDYAERVIFEALNAEEFKYSSLKYGRNDDISAGDEEFTEFYDNYQQELSEIGKKPDLLIVAKDSSDRKNFDISCVSDNEQNTFLLKAVAGLEIRSSSYSYDTYDMFNNESRTAKKKELEKLVHKLESLYENYGLKPNFDLSKVLSSNVTIPRVSTSLPQDIKKEVGNCRRLMSEIKKTDNSLSFTVKVEDIIAIARWISNYGVHHFFVQVLFDKIFMISFRRVLQIIQDKSDYEIAKDLRNQFKTTIKIPLSKGKEIGTIKSLPLLKGEYKLLPRGRIMYFIKFSGGTAEMNTDTVLDIVDSDNNL